MTPSPHNDLAQAVIAEYDQYLARFVTRRNEVVGRLPLCPFAAAARQAKRITYEVGPITAESVVARALDWTRTATTAAILIFLAPDRAMAIEALRAVETAVRQALAPVGWIAFHGHPEHPYTMGGVLTRREPYPSLRIYNRAYLKRGELKLEAGERYYKDIDPLDLEEWEGL